MIPGLQKTVNISTISITGNCNTKQMHLTSSFMKCKKQYLCKNIIFMNFYLSVIKLILHVTTALSAPIPSTTQTTKPISPTALCAATALESLKKVTQSVRLHLEEILHWQFLTLWLPRSHLVILLIVCHIVLVMLVWRICYWIYLQSPKWYFSLFSSFFCLVL